MIRKLFSWRWVDAIAEWLQHGIDTEIQQRFAVLVVLFSIPLFAYGFFAGEPLLVYLMSAFALTLTGITWLTGLQSKRAAEEGPKPPPPVP